MGLFTDNKNENCPTKGYILKNWDQIDYRATAIAYLERENLFSVENVNGKWYNIYQLKNTVNRYNVQK